VTLEDADGNSQRVIWWNGGGQEIPEGQIDLAFVARSRDYQGKREVQVEWVDWRPAEGVEAITPKSQIKVVDHRGASDPHQILSEILQGNPGAAIFSEMDRGENIITRANLRRADTLILWTLPPSPGDLAAVIKETAPQTIYLIDIESDFDSPQAFTKKLAGFAKYAILRKDGQTDLLSLAAATAQTKDTIRAGLAWLQAQGAISYTIEGEQIELREGDGKRQADYESRSNQLKAVLEETAAWRHYLRNASAEAILK
jgi:hypothetical protein